MRTFGGKNGNIVAMLMGTVAMVGIVGVSAMNMIGGPITTAAKVTHQNMAQNDLLMNAKVVVMNASTRPNMGDEDGDGYIEPVPFVPASDPSCGLSLPAGGQGGCLPADIGAILTDPWGTSYAYCVWDHGDPASSPNRIDGEDSTSGAVLAIISAGPNKRFETPCLPYDGDPDTNDEAIDPNGIGDDLVQIFTYAGAVAGSGGLWELKLNEPETAVIDKKLEIGDVAAGTGFAFDTATGEGEFPYIKTDFIASKSGGNTPVKMVNNIALDGQWLSGDGGNRGIFVAPNGKVGIGTSNPLAAISHYAQASRNHSDPITSLEDYGLVLGCKLQSGNCNTGTAVGIAVSNYTNTNSQPAMAMEYRARGHAFHRISGVNPIMRIDPELSYQDSTVVIRAHAANADKGIFGLERNNGAKALTVLNNGNVGIGTSTPKALLHLQGGNSTTTDGVNGVIAENLDNGTLGTRAILRTDGGIALMRPTDANSSNTNGYIDFSASPDLYPEGRYARITWDDNNSAFRFFARDVDDGNPNVPIPFVVSIEGQVGIGTTTPESRLHIIGAENTGTDAALRIQSGSQVMLIDGNEISTTVASGQPLYLNYEVPNNVVLANGGGNVGIGIGTGNPTEKLQVNGLIDVTNNRIIRVATPTAPTDAANKTYVDTLGNRTCANAQILKFQSGSWQCAADNSGGGADNLGGGGTTTGTLYSKNASGYGYIGQDGSNYFRFDAGAGSNRILTRIGAEWVLLNDTSTLRPYANNTLDLGISAARWKNGWFAGDVTSGTLTVNGPIYNDHSSTAYDVWIQGGSASSGEARNLAMLGVISGDYLSINHSSEYTGGTRIGGPVTLNGNTSISGTANITGAITTSVGTIRDTGGGWVRTYNNTGWYNQTYGGGWYMTDSTWIRAYSNKSVVTGGNMQAAAFLYGSDERLKTDITPLNLSLDDLENIHAYRYHYKADKDKTTRIGVIAQEIQAVFPEAVKTGDDGMMSVDYPALVPVLLEAVKQLKADNDAMRRLMKAENDNLREEIRALTKEAR